MKKCPYCAEDIQVDAKKCKHCGEWLPNEQSSAATRATAPVQEEPDFPQQEPDEAPAPSPIPPSRWKLFLSWAIATYCLVSLQYKQFLSADVPAANRWTAVSLIAVEVLFALALIRWFRGMNGNWREKSTVATQLSVWGNAWRAIVGILAGGISLLLVEKVFSLNHMLVDFTPFKMILWEVPRALAITTGTWLLFSRDRRGQMNALFSIMRGY